MTRWATFAWLLAAVALAYGLNVARDARYDASLYGPATRGVVIEGLCPAPVGPVTVTTFSPGRYFPLPDGVFDLDGTAREGEVIISWDDLGADDVTSYLISRYELSSGRRILGETLRVFSIDAAYGSKQFVDDNDLKPYTGYRYRMFPVTADGIRGRSERLEIRTLPTTAPPAPGRLDAQYFTKSLGITSYVGYLQPVTGKRVLRREVGASKWDVVHDGPLGDGERWRNAGPERTWYDEDVDGGVRYEYAVCLINRLGVGRAALVSPERLDATVPVAAPKGIDSLVSGESVTLYWEPIDSRAVIGYEVERFMVDAEDIYNLRLQTDHRTENYVEQARSLLRDVPNHRYRVRAVTVHGPGEWSQTVVVDNTVPRTEYPDWDEYWSEQENDDPEPTVAAPVEEIQVPEVVSLTATHSEVHLVWRAEGSFKDVQERILRREVGSDGPLGVFQLWNWIDVEDYDFDWAFEVSETGFTDQYDVKSSTEYEYAVQLMRGKVLGQPSEWATIRTASLPFTPNRFPMQVYDLAATPTSNGVELTWTLPDDPTLTGIEITARRHEFDIVEHLVEDLVLPPDATSYVFNIRPRVSDDSRVIFSVNTFNSYGVQEQSPSQSNLVNETEYLHCGVGPGGVSRGDNGGTIVTFRGCEESTTEVVRHEVTPDGLESEQLGHQCSWEDSPEYRFSGTIQCEFVDSDAKPDTWYLYKLTQTTPDGRTMTAYVEVITHRRREVQ